MHKTSIIIIAFLLLLSGCANNPNTEEKIETLKIDTLVFSQEFNLFIKHQNENEYQLVAETDGRILKTQMMNGFESELPKVEKVENHWIYLRGGCGSSCFYAYMIPLNVTSLNSIKKYMFPLLVDQKKNIIVYCSEETLTIENYANGRSVSFNDERLVGPYCGFFLENMNIAGTDVVFEINLSTTLIKEKIDIKSLL